MIKMETFVQLLKKVLSDTFIMYYKVQSFHWNVEGQKFIQLHDLFGDMYKEMFDAIDLLAEDIRTHNEYCPTTLKRILEVGEIEEKENIPTADEMIKNLLDCNSILLKTLKITLKFAESNDQHGTVDLLSSRIVSHEKYGWMLRSLLK